MTRNSSGDTEIQGRLLWTKECPPSWLSLGEPVLTRVSNLGRWHNDHLWRSVSPFTLMSRVGPTHLSNQSYTPPVLFSLLEPAWTRPCFPPILCFLDWPDRTSPISKHKNLLHALFNIFPPTAMNPMLEIKKVKHQDLK